MKNPYAIIFSLIFTFIYHSVNGQEGNIINITPEASYLAIKNNNINFEIISAQFKEVDYPNHTEKGESIKKNILVPNDIIRDYRVLNGLYQKLSDKYKKVTHLNSNIVELISDTELQNLDNNLIKKSSRSYQLIKDINSDFFYLIDSDNYIEGIERELSKEKNYFTFVKSTISRIEYLSSVRSDYEFGDSELKKRMLGIFPIEQIDSEINYDDKGYLKFSTIPLNEKFLMITDAEYGYKNYYENLIIQNVKTKKLFAVSAYAMRTFQDHSNMGNQNNGNGWLTKSIPKELSLTEKELIKRFKTLIKNGEEKTKTLNSIEKRHLTVLGYFNASSVNSTDKLLYNKTIDELSSIYKKLYDIYLYEDKNSIAEMSLSTSELASYYSVKKWYNTARKIN